MRILVATIHTIPGFSGGWTTPLDLFGEDHQAMYVIRNYPPVFKSIEGVRVAGTGAVGFLRSNSPFLGRLRTDLLNRLFREQLKRSFHGFRGDFVLCLDPGAGYQAMYAGLPYAMRFHSKLQEEHTGPDFRSLLSNALFCITGPTTGAEGIEELPHNQDLSRFHYCEPSAADRAILLTSIDEVHEPEVFIKGVMLSRGMKGDIVGTGPDRQHIKALCDKTGGRVKCLPPVPRLQIPSLLRNYQIGAATVKKISPVVYQMKVNAYMASGLFTLARPWTHIAGEAPELVRSFNSPEEMAETLDWLQNNWGKTLEIRRRAREWIHENYSVYPARERFNRILQEKVRPFI